MNLNNSALGVKHAAWDGGAVRDAFVQTFGESFVTYTLPLQKTTKTRCEKRVSMRHIDNDIPTCPDCLADIERQRLGELEILAYSQKVQDGKS